MGSFSLIHWIILGIVVLLLFGGNRFSTMMKDVAHGLKSFKQGLGDDDEKTVPPKAETRQIPPSSAPPIDLEARPSGEPRLRDDDPR